MKSKKLNKTSLTIIAVIVAIFTIINASFTFAYFTANKSIDTGSGLNFGKLIINASIEGSSEKENNVAVHTCLVPGCTLTFSGEITSPNGENGSTIDAIVRLQPTVTVSGVGEGANASELAELLLGDIVSKLKTVVGGQQWLYPQSGSPAVDTGNYLYYAGKFTPGTSYSLSNISKELELGRYTDAWQGAEVTVGLKIQALQADHITKNNVEIIWTEANKQTLVNDIYDKSIAHWGVAFPPVVTFNANSGSGTMATQNMAYNTATELNTNVFTAPTGKVFKEWNTQADGTGASYADEAEITATDDITLYAIWEVEPTDFENASWAKIKEIAQNGQASTYNWAVGDEKIIPYDTNNDGDTVDENDHITIQIVHIRTSESDNVGKYTYTENNESKTANVVFQVKEIVTYSKLAATLQEYYYSWAFCAAMKSTLSTIESKLPEELRTRLVACSYPANSTRADALSNEKLFLASNEEVSGTNHFAAYTNSTSADTKRVKENATGVTNGDEFYNKTWWTRSYSANGCFVSVSSEGLTQAGSYANPFGVSFCFAF